MDFNLPSAFSCTRKVQPNRIHAFPNAFFALLSTELALIFSYCKCVPVFSKIKVKKYIV